MSKLTLTNAEFAVLGLLVEGATHGYDLERIITERGMREWTEIGFSSIYFVLGKLEKKGFVLSAKTSNPKARKTFTVTPYGREAHIDRTYHSISEPHAVFPSVLLGLANWSALDSHKASKALELRGDRLRERVKEVQSTLMRQRPVPSYVEALFSYSISQLDAEINWVEQTLKTIEEVK